MTENPKGPSEQGKPADVQGAAGAADPAGEAAGNDDVVVAAASHPGQGQGSDSVFANRPLQRRIAAYAAAVGFALLALFAYPAYEDTTGRSDFAAGRLAEHSAVVLAEKYDSGWDGSTSWNADEFQLRLDDGTEHTKPMNSITFFVHEGDSVSVGLSHGRLISVNGRYVQGPSLWGEMAPLVISSTLVLSAIWSLLLFRPGLAQRRPYISGFVTQAVILSLLFAAVPFGRYEPWEPIIRLVLAWAIPVVIFWLRHRRPVTVPRSGKTSPSPGNSTGFPNTV